ncbi:hypothetical protein BX600DRAFT_442714 [Xylariales sp. PMI_506]|nr:hypothetical protein BX600DRAFT_442714 [Xylariales sp. PMI_506]
MSHCTELARLSPESWSSSTELSEKPESTELPGSLLEKTKNRIVGYIQEGADKILNAIAPEPSQRLRGEWDLMSRSDISWTSTDTSSAVQSIIGFWSWAPRPDSPSSHTTEALQTRTVEEEVERREECKFHTAANALMDEIDVIFQPTIEPTASCLPLLP